MKIVYATTIEYPSMLANRLHVLNMCKAFHENGHDITLLAKSVEYSKALFSIVNIERKRLLPASLKISGWINTHQPDIVYCREPRLFILLFLFTCWRKNQKFIFELHDEPRALIDKVAFFVAANWADRIVVLNKALKKYISQYQLFSKRPIVVAADAVDLEEFNVLKTKPLPDYIQSAFSNRPCAVYTGSFLDWKGVPLLLEAATELPDVNFILIGGRPKQLQTIQERYGMYKNIFCFGHISNEFIPACLSQADYLVLPNSAKIKVSRHYTSPLKLFEYLATGKPILASRLPSISVVLRETKNCFMYEPDNVNDFVSTLQQMIADSISVKNIANQSKIDAQQYTWRKRVRLIMQNE